VSDIQKPDGGGGLSKPLADLLRKAASTLPKTTGETEKQRQRHAHASNARVLLLDVSSSMDDPAGPTKRKIEMLREAVADVLPAMAGCRVIAFSTSARDITGGYIPDPNGGTAMHLGLAMAESLKPRQTLVVSDGQPDSEDSALKVADRMTGVIDVIFCGPDGDTQAISFLQKLARTTTRRRAGSRWR
jgi:hypothetical protein